MSLRINHNIASINGHRNLLNNDVSMSKTLEKLSSGMKINRAADGPAALVISENMRGQIAGMEQAIDNSETAISMVQTAEANLSEVSSLLTSVRQLAIHAANEGVNDEVMLQADQNEIDNALQTIGRIASQAQFGTKKLLDGTNGASGSTTGADLEFINASLNTVDSHANGYEIRVTQSATKAEARGTEMFTQEQVDNGETLTVIENGKTATYTTNSDDSIETAVQNLRSEIRKNALNLDVNLTEEGTISVTHQQYGSNHGFQVSSSTAGLLSTEAGEIELAEAGLDIHGTINGETAVGKGQVLSGIRGAEHTEGLSIKYTGEVNNPDMEADIQAANEASGEEIAEEEVEFDEDGNPIEPPPEERYEGEVVGRVFVHQNSMKFQVGANTGQTVGLSVNSTKPETLSKGIENESGFKNLADIDVRTFQGAQDAITLIDHAINEIAETRGDLGAFQKNTLESNLNNLRMANENLINSESVIRDTDMAAEMAAFTKTQIMSQSATAMLAQANQAPKNVLQLLG